MRGGWAQLGAVLASRLGEVGAMGAGRGGGARDGPEDPPVLDMPRACSVRQWLRGAAAHLFSAAVSVGGSRVEDLGHHCWSEAVRGLVACQADIWNAPMGAQSERCSGAIAAQLRALRIALHLNINARDAHWRRGSSSLDSHGLASELLRGLPCRRNRRKRARLAAQDYLRL